MDVMRVENTGPAAEERSTLGHAAPDGIGWAALVALRMETWRVETRGCRGGDRTGRILAEGGLGL